MGASHDEPTQDAAEKRITVIHPKGLALIPIQAVQAIKRISSDEAATDRYCHVDYQTGLVLSYDDPFFQDTVTMADAIKKCRLNPAYFELIQPEDYTDELLTMRLKEVDNYPWGPNDMPDFVEIALKGGITKSMLTARCGTFIKAALRTKNVELLDKVLQESECDDILLDFWHTVYEAIRDKEDDFAAGLAKALVRSKVNTFGANDKHQTIVHIIMARGVLEQYYDLVAFMAKIYSNYANAQFARGICYYTDLVARLLREGHISPELLPEFKPPAQDDQADQVITSVDEFNEEIMKLIARFKPAKKQ